MPSHIGMNWLQIVLNSTDFMVYIQLENEVFISFFNVWMSGSSCIFVSGGIIIFVGAYFEVKL